MSTGEFEYDTIFGNTDDDDNKLITFEVLATLLWIVFLIMMPILLINLLIGLAVGDTQAIQDKAELRRIEIQIKHLLETEELLTLVPKCFKCQFNVQKYDLYPNRKLKCLKLLEEQLGIERWYSVDNIKKCKQTDMQSVVGHTESGVNELAQQMKEVKVELAKRPKVDESLYEDMKTDLARKTDEIRTDLARKTDEIGKLSRATENLGKEFAGEIRNLKADLARTNQLMEEILKKMA
jgi:transient receptor potential cation channel subfamily A protein 1